MVDVFGSVSKRFNLDPAIGLLNIQIKFSKICGIASLLELSWRK